MSSHYEEMLKKPIPGEGLLCECAGSTCLRRLNISYQWYRNLRGLGDIMLEEHVRPGSDIVIAEDGWVLVKFKKAKAGEVLLAGAK